MNLLVKNLSELKQFITITGDFNFEIIEPYLKSVQLGDATRFFGPVLNTLVARHHEETPSPAITAHEEVAIELMSSFIAHVAIAKAMPVLLVHVGASGLFQKEGSNTKPVYQWQKIDFEETHFELGYDALEAALEYLIANRDVDEFEDWKECAEEEKAAELFVRSAALFNDRFPIGNSRRTYEALRVFINEVEKFELKPLLGPSLFALVKTELKTFDLSEANEALLPYIQDVIANATVVKSIGRLNVKMTSEGMMVTSYIATGKEITKNKRAASAGDLGDLRKDANAAANQYKVDLMRFLNDHVGDYPLWTESEEYKALNNGTTMNSTESKSVML